MAERFPDLDALVLRAGQPADWPAEVTAAIEAFEPLPYDAGRRAAEWLKRVSGAEALPLDLYLLVHRGSGDLFGFFVIEPETVVISRGDAPVVQVRTGIVDPAEEQASSLLVWMARSKYAPPGFGEFLFEAVVADAVARGSSLIRVSPADTETEERIWVGRFNFRRPRADSEVGWVFLWYGVGEPDQTFG